MHMCTRTSTHSHMHISHTHARLLKHELIGWRDADDLSWMLDPTGEKKKQTQGLESVITALLQRARWVTGRGKLPEVQGPVRLAYAAKQSCLNEREKQRPNMVLIPPHMQCHKRACTHSSPLTFLALGLQTKSTIPVFLKHKIWGKISVIVQARQALYLQHHLPSLCEKFCWHLKLKTGELI